MNIGIDGIVEEIICNCLSDAGISDDLIRKILDDIKYNCSETNFMNNSVATSNYYAAEERKENERIVAARKEVEELENKRRKEKEDAEYELRRLRNTLSDYVDKYGRIN